MPDSAATQCVFLDTEVFDKHHFHFESPNIKRLVRLASCGSVKLFLTTVTEQEIRSHLDSDVSKTFKTLSNYNRLRRVTKQVVPEAQFEADDEERFRSDLHREFDEFIAHAKVTILSVGSVSVEEVFEAFFAKTPPFDKEDKKSEFPDAFAIVSLRDWCELNGRKMYVVTNDGDWRRTCKLTPCLLHVDLIGELLEKFQNSEIVADIRDAVQSQTDELERLIIEKADGFDVSVSDSLVDAEHEDFSIDSVEFAEFHVVEADDGCATISVYCTLTVSADVKADDPDSMWKDPDNGDYNSVWSISGRIEQQVEIEASIRCSFDLGLPSRAKILGVDLESNEIELDPDEGELFRDDDDEREDEYFGPDI